MCSANWSRAQAPCAVPLLCHLTALTRIDFFHNPATLPTRRAIEPGTEAETTECESQTADQGFN